MNSGSRIKAFDSVMKAERDYWVERLSSGWSGSSLPVDRKRPDTYPKEIESMPLVLGRELSDKLEKVTGGSRFLLYVFLMTGLKVLLHKYSGGDRIAVGSPTCRAEDQEDLAGALAIVDGIVPERTFKSVLMTVHANLKEAYSKQGYPFDRLVRDLGLKGRGGRCPLFDVALTLAEIHGAFPAVKNDVTIGLRVSEAGVAGTVEYRGDLFERRTVELFAGHFRNVLRQALENSDTPVADLDPMGGEERQLVLVERNRTVADYPAGSFHDLFARQAARTPEAAALISGAARMSYVELDRRANQLAHRLIRQGVGPEVVVGLCVSRSFDMIVGLLGILKAGGIYAPFDLDYPRERLAFMMDCSQARVVVTQERWLEKLPPTDAQVICIDRDSESLAAEPDQAPAERVTADNLAYVIFTSGSTGQPKGVGLSHRGLCNLAYAQAQAFGVVPASRVLQFASASFDASISEVAMTLASGAALYLAPQEEVASPPSLARLIRDHGITAVTLPPAVLAELAAEDLPQLRSVIVAGEACPGDLAARWSDGRRFFNAYGPTETTVCASYMECKEVYPLGPPIGCPLANTQIYVVERGLRPVPSGGSGELLVGGVGLARGYLGQPGLTAERFIPDPFSGDPGARLYRSGDLARLLPGGDHQFLGRIDHQVKIRGHRVEPGEVEAQLARHAAVREAVVVSREDTPGVQRLLAYLVAQGDRTASVGELRSFLLDKLPDYMVPAGFVFLERLPLSPSGKVDRHALPVPDRERPNLEMAFVAPRTPVEESLVQMWAEVLGIERIGIQDNFFELGGHSLQATRIISRIRESLGVEMELPRFLKAPTVASLAEAVAEKQGARMRGADPMPAKISRESKSIDEQLADLDLLSEEEAEVLVGQG
jgi:amino acid adenylation domain-containing protein